MQGDLTTITHVKNWLKLPSTSMDADAVLTRLITQVSRVVMSHLQRPTLFKQSYDAILDGVAGPRIIIPTWPVLSITSLDINGVAIPASTRATGQPPTFGYALDVWDGIPSGTYQALTLFGRNYGRGVANVRVQYVGGYVAQDEAHVIAATVAASQPYGLWAVDEGVLIDGVAATAVAAAPAAGQYVAPVFGADTPGVYTFAVADAGKTASLSYSYIPYEINEAVTEQVGERFRYAERIGQTSKTLGGQETVSYQLKDLPDWVKFVLDDYRRDVPL